MRSLILGAGGQVGRALVRSAPSQASVVAIGRSECDITSPSAVTAAIARSGADLVFNAAGYTAVDRAEAEPEEAMRINGQAPGQIAQACAAAGARLVHLSSDFVFDGSKSEPYRPGDPARPLSVYGRSKREGELGSA